MNTTLGQTVAAGSGAGTVAVVALGLLITAMLVWSVRFGIRVRGRESAPPRRRDQPTLPESGPVHEERQMREPNEVPRAADENGRLTPHQLGNDPSRRSENQSRPRWERGGGS
ncbi:hypothetical protein JCM4814A_86700 [Streptomyces phaeofaciens JCM 4814]|uniref:Secreted protein n=1 Tax=Streptomyces phaeofaciens TaxID=68254 RepID=A0A918H9U7_9ACTN|nr:DUF6479 family protein [Streptomyces phaeofaciens]GGT45123.1 hypothetical protein GCM10010226_22280 [Streptomyces phaeofaciens]